MQRQTVQHCKHVAASLPEICVLPPDPMPPFTFVQEATSALQPYLAAAHTRWQYTMSYCTQELAMCFIRRQMHRCLLSLPQTHDNYLRTSGGVLCRQRSLSNRGDGERAFRASERESQKGD